MFTNVPSNRAPRQDVSRAAVTSWLSDLADLGLACAAQDVDQLVADNFLDVGAGGLQVLTGIEVGGILVEVLTDGAGHSQA